MNPVDPKHKVGDTFKVRNMSGVYEVTKITRVSTSFRYRLKAVDKTCIYDDTQAWEADLHPAERPAPAATMPAALPDSPVQEPAAGDDSEPAPPLRFGAAALPEAIPDGPNERAPYAYSVATGELAETASPDAPDDSAPRSDDSPRPLRRKLLRPFPTYETNRLREELYKARIRGTEGIRYKDLVEGTPIHVAVTRESNGHAVWIECAGKNDDLNFQTLEQYYTGTDPSPALEHGVLLAQALIPSRDEEIEIALLSL